MASVNTTIQINKGALERLRSLKRFERNLMMKFLIT